MKNNRGSFLAPVALLNSNTAHLVGSCFQRGLSHAICSTAPCLERRQSVGNHSLPCLLEPCQHSQWGIICFHLCLNLANPHKGYSRLADDCLLQIYPWQVYGEILHLSISPLDQNCKLCSSQWEEPFSQDKLRYAIHNAKFGLTRKEVQSQAHPLSLIQRRIQASKWASPPSGDQALGARYPEVDAPVPTPSAIKSYAVRFLGFRRTCRSELRLGLGREATVCASALLSVECCNSDQKLIKRLRRGSHPKSTTQHILKYGSGGLNGISLKR